MDLLSIVPECMEAQDLMTKHKVMIINRISQVGFPSVSIGCAPYRGLDIFLNKGDGRGQTPDSGTRLKLFLS